MLLIFNLLQSGYYTTEPVASRYDAATMGMFVLIIVIGVIGYIVQARLQHVFKKYSEVPFPGGLTGAEVAEKMLRDNKIHNVKITHVSGQLTDHFNPQTMTVNLSDAVYSSRSVAAAAVACHECGHAIQHAQGYAPLALRSQLVPIVQFSSRMAMFVIIIGLVILASTQNELLCWIGSLLDHHPAGGIQRFAAGPRLAPEQPHARRRTARTSQGSPLVGCPHLPGSGLECRSVAALLRFDDFRTP